MYNYLKKIHGKVVTLSEYPFWIKKEFDEWTKKADRYPEEIRERELLRVSHVDLLQKNYQKKALS